MVIVGALGLGVGALSGFSGGRVDLALMRLIDIVMSFPSLLFVLLLSVVLGSGVFNIILAIGFTRWAPLARIVRAEFLRVRRMEFVLAAEALGGTALRVAARHVLPNTLAPVVVYLTFGVPFAIMAEAALGFIGLGVTPPSPSWGVMLNEGFSSFRALPNLVLFPSLALSLTMFGFVMFGNGLRDFLDPRTRR
jgi:ABC-type dipeptide/oligopeptide/nickel transport system permease subunit